MHNVSTQFDSLISDRDRQIYEVVNFVAITGIISMFGISTNIMNIAVFYKQGFSNAMTISFFALAISDMCSLLTSVGLGVFMNPLFINEVTHIIPHEMLHLSVGIPHICFTRITAWITVFVTAERCLCITAPLKVKQIITTQRTSIIVTLIYITLISCSIHEYSTVYYGYKFYIPGNRTLLGLMYRVGYAVDGLVYFIYSILGLSSFVAVITFTVTLVVQLSRKSRWRMKASIIKNQTKSISDREKKAMTMVVMIATVLIVCYTPSAVICMIGLFQAEFSIVGKYVNIFFTLWSFVFVLDVINSSVNIFFYYSMSSKYRETFHATFGSCITAARGAPDNMECVDMMAK